jgi:hypothetical protein
MSLSKIDRQRFMAHLKYWQHKLSLTNYTVVAQDDYDGLGGQCNMNHTSLVAIVSIGETDEVWTLERIARHEMLELLLEPFYSICDDVVHGNRSYKAAHEIIHRLEEILPLPTDKEVGFKMPCGKKKKPKGK